MAVNWNRYRATVEKAIEEYGRPVTMVDDGAPADPTKPLAGPAAPTLVTGVKAVFVRPSGYIKLGESDEMITGMWPEADKIFLCLPSLTYRFQDFTRVIDSDNRNYKIYKTELLQPGPVPLLIYVGLRL